MTDSFRTKGGRCVLEDDTIRVERRPGGALGTLRDGLTSGELPLVRRVGLALFLLALGVGVGVAVTRAPTWLLGAAAGVVLAWVVWRRSRGPGQPEETTIPVDLVVDVEAEPGLPLVTRPRFVLRYRDEGGVKHRYLPCPSRLYGFDAYETGRELFDRLGLLKTE